MERSLKLIAYLEGDLDARERRALQEELRQDQELQKELNKLEELYRTLESEPEAEVPESLRSDFEAILASEKKAFSRQKVWVSWTGRVAAAVTLIAVGIWMGISIGSGDNQQEQQLTKLQEQIKANRELILKSLEKPSASQRIMAVSASNEIHTPDAEIVDALVKVMNTDDNTNVRLAAVRALSRFPQQAQIRQALIDAVVTQSDPLVQVFLIDILVDKKEKSIVPTLEKLIESDTTIDAVKDEAQWGVLKLS